MAFRWFKNLFVSQVFRRDEYVYLSVEEIILFNERVTGIRGQLRDLGALESAIVRPQMASYYEDADIVTQTALLVDAICTAHAFNDGNKRTALLACTTFLYINGFRLQRATRQIGKEIESLVIKGNVDKFATWIRSHIQTI